MANNGVLLHNGSPFYIQGAVTWGYGSLEELVEAGRNAIRARPDRTGLNKAKKLGLAALVDLPVRGERHGLDWDNEKEVEEQKRKILKLVEYYKDHPAVMKWSVGNELAYVPTKPTGEEVQVPGAQVRF